MVPFDRLHKKSATVTIALSCIVLELFDVE